MSLSSDSLHDGRGKDWTKHSLDMPDVSMLTTNDMNTKLTLKKELGTILQYTPAERARAIIDSPRTKEILEQLSPQETYMILKESWGTDSQILLQYMPPETICHCIDMDCWDKDAVSVEGVLDWLWEVYNSSIETLQDALQAIDLDIIILLYQTYIDVVQVVPTDENIAVLLDEGYESFDDIYYFVFREEDEKTQLLKDMLSLIFTHYQNVYYSIMEGVIWEMRSSIEESIYERRSLRLMEMGFPPPDEAMSIYHRMQPEKLVNEGLHKEKTPILDREQGFLPALYLDELSRGTTMIVTSLAESTPETRERFVFEMIYLANKIIMAEYRPLNEVEELKHSIEKASSLASLGLAAAMKTQGRPSWEVLENMNAETLFSLGYNLVQGQKARLKQILRDVPVSMIPGNLNGFVEGLMKKRPMYKNEEFSTMEQLQEVTRNIDRIEAMNLLMDRLGWSGEDEKLDDTNTGGDIDMETVILTSLAANSLAGEHAFRPLERGELMDFITRTTTINHSGRRILIPEFRNGLAAFLESLETSLDPGLMGEVADLLMNRFEDELSGIKDIKELDPRFITCFVARI